MDQHVDPTTAMYSAMRITGFAHQEGAFSVSDLMLIRAWTESHDVQLAVWLDYRPAPGDDFREVIALDSVTAALDHLVMWRDASAVNILPLFGGKMCFDTVPDALAHLLPERDVEQTDILATVWPVD